MDSTIYYLFSFDCVKFFIGVKVGDEVRNCLIISYAKDPETNEVKGYLKTPLPFDLSDLEDKPILPIIPIDKISMIIDLKDAKDCVGILEEYNRYIKYFFEDRFIENEINNNGN